MTKIATDLEQSKKLAEILPLESADMLYYCSKESNTLIREEPFIRSFKETNTFSYVPCWSLAALLDVLPEGVIENYYAPNLQKENGKYSIAYGNEELLGIADNPIDACYEMILKLYELKTL